MNDRRLVIDISKWQDHVKPEELEGVEAVILKSGSGMFRDPKFEKHGAVIANAGITMMAYHWDDITVDPAEQAEWALEDIAKVGLPVKFIWADQEQS
jgi:GH25 family lysozyme M1 (1,4-beta-N-acetylmuramidase)